MTGGPSRHRVHRPITDAFRGASIPRLSGDDVASFAERGFVERLPLLDRPQVAELRSRLESIRARIAELEPRLYEVESDWTARPDEVVLHFLGAWLVDDWFHDLVFHGGVTRSLLQLLDVPSLRFWHDQVFWKPPRHPGVVPWHQDYSYWTRTAPPSHITMFIALDDMTDENGGLRYVPGSHRAGLLPTASFGGDMGQVWSPASGGYGDPVPVRLRAGEASIHHSHTVHGSFANRSDRPRRAIVLNYMGPHVKVVDGSAPLLRNTARIETGEVVAGDHFPIVAVR